MSTVSTSPAISKMPLPATRPLPEADACRILVVDDQPSNIQILGTVLGNLGHELILAGDGATALKRAALRKPDLILLDLLMPEMDGCEVCRQLKANPELKNIPVIFLSAADDKELIVRALNSGGIDYITKPFNHAELVSRVRTQLALKSAYDRLAQLAEDKDELIGILTHDLKNHIGGISMSAMLLHQQLEKAHDGKMLQLSENIRRSSEQLLAFVKEFLANAATDFGFTIKSTPVDAAKIAVLVVQQYQEMAQRKKLEIIGDFPAEIITVYADPTALSQVLDNLVSNAIKFSPVGKKIYVSVRVTASHVECMVRDEGPGFKPEDKARMFKRYGRLSARPTGGEPSTGLGLSIVSKLVTAMNGELACNSGPGSGAVFTVLLPRPTE